MERKEKKSKKKMKVGCYFAVGKEEKLYPTQIVLISALTQVYMEWTTIFPQKKKALLSKY